MILNEHLSQGALRTVDWLSVATLLASIANVLPSVATLLTIVWSVLRIYEMKTVQELLGRGSVPASADDEHR